MHIGRALLTFPCPGDIVVDVKMALTENELHSAVQREARMVGRPYVA